MEKTKDPQSQDPKPSSSGQTSHPPPISKSPSNAPSTSAPASSSEAPAGQGTTAPAKAPKTEAGSSAVSSAFATIATNSSMAAKKSPPQAARPILVPTLPPIPIPDPKEMEERSRAARAYAMGVAMKASAKPLSRQSNGKGAGGKNNGSINNGKNHANNARNASARRGISEVIDPIAEKAAALSLTSIRSAGGSLDACTPPAASVAAAAYAMPIAAKTKTKAATTTSKNSRGRTRQTNITATTRTAGMAPTKGNRSRGRPRKPTPADAIAAATVIRDADQNAKTPGNNSHNSFNNPQVAQLPTAWNPMNPHRNSAKSEITSTAGNASTIATTANVAAAPSEGAINERSSLLLHQNESDDEDEYARFMRSIMNGDDASIMTFRTLASATANNNVGKDMSNGANNAPSGDGGGGPNLGTIIGDNDMIGSAFDDLDDDSYHLTSEEEDDDDDDDDGEDENDHEVNDDENNDVQKGKNHAQPQSQSREREIEGEEKKESDNSPKKAPPLESNEHTHTSTGKVNEEYISPDKQSKKGTPLPPTPMSGSSTIVSRDGTEEDFDNLNVFGEIEGLMEEDLEAAAATLLQSEPLNSSPIGESSFLRWQHGSTSGAAGHGANAKLNMKSISASETVGIGQAPYVGTQQQKAITTPGLSTKKKKSTTTVVTTPSPGLSSPDASNLSHGSASQPRGSALLTGPVITGHQLRSLRKTMARHHQLLLQQATLAVRAAYVQKVQKDGSVSNSNYSTREQSSKRHKTSSTLENSLPPSRLNSRSLTFCTPEQNCTYENDFFSGENADELAEVLDGAVGMLQDLEQNWKDAVRNSIQLSFASNNGNACGASVAGPASRRKLLPTVNEKGIYAEDDKISSRENNNDESSNGAMLDRRLTRSAFTKTLREREMEMLSQAAAAAAAGKSSYMDPVGNVRQRVSAFDVRGLGRLRETFAAIDNSVKDAQMGKTPHGKNSGAVNILLPHDVSVLVIWVCGSCIFLLCFFLIYDTVFSSMEKHANFCYGLPVQKSMTCAFPVV
ncbi:hypothetical protein ACHAXS_008615 [Conticribra weissflogii]